MSETIADQIRTARREAGMSQRKLAECAGVGISTITDIEQGITKNPRYGTVLAILAAIRCHDEDATQPSAGALQNDQSRDLASRR